MVDACGRTPRDTLSVARHPVVGSGESEIGKGTTMSLLFGSIIAGSVKGSRIRQCSACGRRQLVPQRRRSQVVTCKRCGRRILPPRAAAGAGRSGGGRPGGEHESVGAVRRAKRLLRGDRLTAKNAQIFFPKPNIQVSFRCVIDEIHARAASPGGFSMGRSGQLGRARRHRGRAAGSPVVLRRRGSRDPRRSVRPRLRP